MKGQTVLKPERPLEPSPGGSAGFLVGYFTFARELEAETQDFNDKASIKTARSYIGIFVKSMRIGAYEVPLIPG